jgi:hypothetical protein
VNYGDPYPAVLAFSTDGAASPTLKAWVNGLLAMTDSTGNLQATTDITVLTLGARLNAGTPALLFKGHISESLLFNRVLTDAENEAVRKAMRFLDPDVANYVFHGDSQTAFVSSRPGQDYPWQLLNRVAPVAARQYNVARSGIQVSAMLSRYATEVRPFRPHGSVTEGHFFLLGGTNDIIGGGTAADIYGVLKTIWAQARADGFKVHACTLFDQTWTAPQRVVYDALNILIISDLSLFDVVYRLDLLLNDHTSDAAFYVDSYHLNAAGNLAVANKITFNSPLP